MVEKKKKRNPVFALQRSLKNAKEFYFELCGIYERVEASIKSLNIDPKELKKLITIQKALSIALIVEIGRIFDTYETETKKVISFKKVFKGSKVENIINEVHGTAIICKILKTRKTFTAHIGENEEEIASIKDIRDSNLGNLLQKLDEPLNAFTVWFTQNRGWEQL